MKRHAKPGPARKGAARTETGQNIQGGTTIFGWHAGSFLHWCGGLPGLLLFLLVLGVAAYTAVRFFAPRVGIRDRRDSLDILKRRLASGEISVEDFEKLKRYL